MALELNSAYFQSLKKNDYDQLGGEVTSDPVNYAQWNMGEESFNTNLLDYGLEQNGGKGGADLENWILHNKPPKPKDGGQVSRNAIRFGMYLEAFKKLYN